MCRLNSTQITRDDFRWRAAFPVLLFVLVVAVYTRSSGNEFIYDDHRLIVEQPAVDSWSDVLQVFSQRHWYNLPYYRPVARLTMVVQKRMHGDQPGPYHLLNALMAGNAAIVAYLLFRLPAFGISAGWALFAAGLFALHPIASSCVYPICSGRESLLPAIFGTAAVWAYLRSTRATYWLAMVLLVIALLCKEQAIVVPILFALADILRLASPPLRPGLFRWTLRYAPVVLIVTLYLAIRFILFGGGGEHHLSIIERPSGLILSALYGLQVTFVPFVQLLYEPRVEVWFSWWRQLCWMATAIPIVVMVYGNRREVGTRVLFFMSWTLLTMLPTANIFQQEARFAERYSFWSLLGLVAIVATLGSRVGTGRTTRQFSPWILAVLLVISAMISFHRGTYFQNDLVFLKQWLRTDPESVQARVSLGHRMVQNDQLDVAVDHFQEALRLRPDYADVHLRLAEIHERRDEIEEAARHGAEAVRLQPDSAEAHNKLGVVRAIQGDWSAAIRDYREALRLRPDYADAHNNLGASLAHRQQWSEAALHYERALELNAENVQAWYNLGQLNVKRGEFAKAAHALRRALSIAPDHAAAHNELGVVFAVEGDLDQAIIHFQRAVELQPEYRPARDNLERARDKLRRKE